MVYFFFLVYVYMTNFKSFMNSLLVLESMSLVIFFYLVFFLYFFLCYKICVLYFIFIVCESSIGLSILVKSVKFYGNMNFKSMNLSMF